MLRARGRAIGAFNTGSSGLIESVQAVLLAPKFERIEKLDNDTLTLNCVGAPNQSCLLLATSNLAPPVQWTPIATNTTDSHGLLSFPSVEISSFPQRFFRLSQNRGEPEP